MVGRRDCDGLGARIDSKSEVRETANQILLESTSRTAQIYLPRPGGGWRRAVEIHPQDTPRGRGKWIGRRPTFDKLNCQSCQAAIVELVKHL